MNKQRIQVTFDDITLEILSIIAKKERRPKSEIVRRMVENWMETYEDQYWVEITNKMNIDRENTISAHEVFSCIK